MSLTRNIVKTSLGIVSARFRGNDINDEFGLLNSSWWSWAGLLLLTILLLGVYDQGRYLYQKGSIAGPAWKLPFIGAFMQSLNPKFEEYQIKWQSGGISCVSVFHKFVVIASARDIARKVFNSPAYVKPCVVDIAHKLLRPTNWVFLDGKAHNDYRKGLNGLFTRKALNCYLPGQEEVYDNYFKKFIQLSQAASTTADCAINHDTQINKSENEPQTKNIPLQPIPFMPVFRELMCAVSCRTFVGYYMSDQTVKRIADDYYKITAALDLVNFPYILPFTRPWYGKRAADMVLEEFSLCAAKSKVRMATGADADCILDRWVQSMLDSEAYRNALEENGQNADHKNSCVDKPDIVIRMFTDYEIAQTLFTFLFASQDATSSACTWLFQLLADRPAILDKVREENMAVRGGDLNKPLTMDLLDRMTYTRAVVKETLRYRPPVTMVPYIAKKAFPISDSYTVPKGSMVIPTLYPSLHDPDAYPQPEEFDPDRWITGNAEQQRKNWLVFGTGPHYCLGQTYAQFNLIALIGKASLTLNWHHTKTPDSERIKVFATIFPMDDCLLTFEPRSLPTSCELDPVKS